MTAARRPQCPECKYLLVGLTVPRCPECGQQFDPRWLTQPELSLPRPAWERWRRIGFLRAVFWTLFDVTFRPRRFFQGIQQPDRLRWALSWLIFVAFFCWLTVVTGEELEESVTRFFWARAFGPDWSMHTYYLFKAAKALRDGTALLAIPLGFLLLTADLLLWRQRAQYRLFFKGVFYSLTVYLWLAAVVCAVSVADIVQAGLCRSGTVMHRCPWTGWLFAAAVTWQYILIFRCVLGPRSAASATLRQKPRSRLRMLVAAAWCASIYLALFDVTLGLRYPIVDWS